ncbi:hypothetical protein L1049_008932 [Liquidambar formosana]|uniref:Protein phosphatase n=1 Tax=Liquidambar formosana TaxID=63359 RepID=A0AAP0X4X1_LIQFO
MIVKRRRIEGTLEVSTAVTSGLANLHGANSSNKSLKMVSGAFYLPKDNEKKPQGEDAHFICSEEHTIGLADGVGGWAKDGVDAGEYARELMNNSVIAIHNEPKGAIDLKRVLTEAYSNTKAEGSSTACIITLTGNWVHAVNLGDSGFMVFRDKKLRYQSPVQQHKFNVPYQLGNYESSDRPASAKAKYLYSQNFDSQELKVAVEPGDIIVAGTDGLLDNMYATEIEEILKQYVTIEGVQPQQLSWTIAELALYNSLDKYAHTPFAEASRLAGKRRRGGKIDDITVIVGHIVTENQV